MWLLHRHSAAEQLQTLPQATDDIDGIAGRLRALRTRDEVLAAASPASNQPSSADVNDRDWKAEVVRVIEAEQQQQQQSQAAVVAPADAAGKLLDITDEGWLPT